MKLPIIIAVVIVIMIVSAVLFFRSRVAESGTRAEIASRLTKLKQDTSPTAFLGFCTRDEDALYFVYIDDTFFLDYELTTPQKRSYEEAFRKTASALGFEVTDTTYGDFPVLRVKIDGSEAHAAKVGCDFADKIFGQDQNTIVEFLP